MFPSPPPEEYVPKKIQERILLALEYLAERDMQKTHIASLLYACRDDFSTSPEEWVRVEAEKKFNPSLKELKDLWETIKAEAEEYGPFKIKMIEIETLKDILFPPSVESVKTTSEG